MFKEVKEVVSKIKKECGNKVFENKDILLNVYYDYGVNLSEKIEQLFKLFIDCDGFKEALNVHDIDKDAKYIVQKLTVKMTNKAFVNEAIAREFCQAVYCGLYNLDTMPRKENKQTYQQKTEDGNSVEYESGIKSIGIKKSVIILIILLSLGICFTMTLSTNSYAKLVESAKFNYEHEKYDLSLKQYAKALSKSDVTPEDYKGFADSLALYFIHSETIDNTYVEKLNIDARSVGKEGVEKFPENPVAMEAERTINAAWQYRDTLLAASQMDDPVQAEAKYDEILSIIPEYQSANNMKFFNSFEKYLYTEDWDAINAAFREHADYFEDETYYVHDQEVGKIKENQYAMKFDYDGCYLGFMENNNFQGQGTLYECYDTSEEGYYITKGPWEKSHGNGDMTYIEKDMTSTKGFTYEMTYQGKVIDDLFDGTVHVSWIDNGYFGEGNITVEHGKIIPIEEVQIEGETEKCYHYITNMSPDYSNWYIRESELYDFGI